ncbi:hypothetical protein [Veillonella agrestimuris]|uniref:hypothetical protein n=1 Tax=Veillonella agrestimuris TaxID=2941340 RepID=UPI00203A8C82|nr:hypothetical protein [Veillonella agrestimuris]
MLPALLIGAAVLIGGKGVKDGIDGKNMQDEAERLKRSAERRYDEGKEKADKCIKVTESSLEKLGLLQLSISQSFTTFRTLADDLIAKMNQAGVGEGKMIEIPIKDYKLEQIKCIEMEADDYLAATAKGVASSAAAGFAVYGGVMTFGTASTGTAIAGLSGVAATNASLAAIGGGSLAAGGLGVAGGTAILGGLVAAPVIAIAGRAYKSKMEEGLKAAQQYEKKVNEIIEKYNTICEKHEGIQIYVSRITKELKRLNLRFNKYIEKLKMASVMSDEEIDNASEDIITDISNGYMLAAILADIIATPLFKMRKETDKTTGESRLVPKTDGDQCFITNDKEMDKVLNFK